MFSFTDKLRWIATCLTAAETGIASIQMMEETTDTSNVETAEQYNQFGQFVSAGYNHTMLIMIAEYFCAIGQANRLMLFCQPFPIQHSL